jgi:hypothetical protein
MKHEFTKCEIVKCLGIGAMVKTHSHMEIRAINKGKRLLSGGKLRFLSKHTGH